MGSKPPVGVAAEDDHPTQPQSKSASDNGHQAGLGQHHRQDLAVGKTDGFKYPQFAGAFAHGLRHGVACDKKKRKEDRAQNRRNNQSDVTNLAGPGLH